MFSATVIISMVLTPLTIQALRFLPKPAQSMVGIEEPDGLNGDVLIIGFGRFGQIASQALLAKGHKISLIDTDTDMIRAAAQFGAKVYYGDGTRLDILRAAGIEKVDVVVIAVDKRDDALKIAELLHSEYPLIKVMARAFDRTRLQTHITRFPYLIADRTAWNKLFRRSFWDEHGFRFPRGVYYEEYRHADLRGPEEFPNGHETWFKAAVGCYVCPECGALRTKEQVAA